MVKSTRPRRKAGSRFAPQVSSALGAWEDGSSDVRGLQEEMSSWKENLEGNNMEHLPKYDEVSECADVLETVADELEGIDFPEVIQDIEVKYTQDTRQSAQSRAGRLDNALNCLTAAISAAEEWMQDNPELTLFEGEDGEEPGDDEVATQEEVDEREEQRTSIQEWLDDAQQQVDELQNVGFPGMY